VKYRVIDLCREAYPIRLMCRCLKVSPSGYYGWCDRPMSPRARENQRLLERIRVLYAESGGILGAGRILEYLRDEGETASLNRVARLMREDESQAIPCKKKHRNKKAGTRPTDVENHLARDSAADKPNTKWVTDITHVRVVGGLWLYLCVVVDLHSGIVVGCSVSGAGSCVDNAACEGFFGMLKRERVNRRRYETHVEARADIFDYIERFYNPRRRRKMEAFKLKESNLTQPSVVSR
jgi:putative transposase